MNTSFTDPFPLERYVSNITHLARQGAFLPLAEYEIYVTQIFQIFLRQTHHKYNPLLLDSDEQRRVLIVTEAVRQMAAGSAPDPLPAWQVIALNYEALFADLPASLEEFSSVLENRSNWLFPQTAQQSNAEQIVFSRLQSLLLAMRQSERKIVLFVDYFHRLLGGGDQRYQIDIPNLLVPALARREIQIIGACTFAQYREHIERFAAIERRFQLICLQLDEKR